MAQWVQISVTPEFQNYEGDDPAGFVVSLNLHRRHLNESQRAAVAAKLANLTRSDAAAISNCATANLQLQSQTRAEAAEMLNVSERSVNTAKAVLNKGAPELVEKVEQGSVSVSAAAYVATKKPVTPLPITAQSRSLSCLFNVYTLIIMKIDYDPTKEAKNLGKHKLSLTRANDLEWSELLAVQDERADYGEVRMIGYAPIGERLYCVVYTDRDNVRRVISLRKANKREVLSYAKQQNSG